MNRYRIRYKKTGPMRYISHLDLLRTFERGARRAGLPLAYTRGYNPHPRLTFAAPLPVGVEGWDEYVDLDLSSPMSPSLLAGNLNRCLPAGLEILEVTGVSGAGPSLMAVVDRATYRAEGRLPEAMREEDLLARLGKFMDRPEIWIEKKTKKGSKFKNIRPGIIDLSGEINGQNILLRMTLKTGSRENVRPEEVLGTLGKGYLPMSAEDFRITRTGLFTGENRPLNTHAGG